MLHAICHALRDLPCCVNSPHAAPCRKIRMLRNSPLDACTASGSVTRARVSTPSSGRSGSRPALARLPSACRRADTPSSIEQVTHYGELLFKEAVRGLQPACYEIDWRYANGKRVYQNATRYDKTNWAALTRLVEIKCLSNKVRDIEPHPSDGPSANRPSHHAEKANDRPRGHSSERVDVEAAGDAAAAAAEYWTRYREQVSASHTIAFRATGAYRAMTASVAGEVCGILLHTHGRRGKIVLVHVAQQHRKRGVAARLVRGVQERTPRGHSLSVDSPACTGKASACIFLRCGFLGDEELMRCTLTDGSAYVGGRSVRLTFSWRNVACMALNAARFLDRLAPAQPALIATVLRARLLPLQRAQLASKMLTTSVKYSCGSSSDQALAAAAAAREGQGHPAAAVERDDDYERARDRAPRLGRPACRWHARVAPASQPAAAAPAPAVAPAPAPPAPASPAPSPAVSDNTDVDDDESTEADIARAAALAAQGREPVHTQVRPPVSDALARLGEAEGEGGCYPLAVLAGHEVQDERHIKHPSKATRKIVKKPRGDAVSLLVGSDPIGGVEAAVFCREENPPATPAAAARAERTSD